MSVVIVTYNSEREIEALLDTVPDAMGSLEYHLTVVDNGSTDSTIEMVRASGGANLLIELENHGYAAGVNAGVIGSPSAPAILILNPDTRLAPDSVPPLVAALSAPTVGVAAPKTLDLDGTLSRSLRRVPSLGRASGLGFTRLAAFSEYVADDAVYEIPHDVDWVLGAAVAVSTDCYHDLNGWDESYFLYSEETDFCLRAREAGWRVTYEPRSVVTHVGGGSGRDHKTHVMQIVNRVRLYRRQHGWLAACVYHALTVVSECSWILRGHDNSMASVAALVRPARRPAELDAPTALPL